MTNKEVGRVLLDQALVASDEAATHLHPTGFDPSRIAADVEAILTKAHDRHMNNYGFLRDADGQWRTAPLQQTDEHGGSKANAVFSVRCLVRAYFGQICSDGNGGA